MTNLSLSILLFTVHLFDFPVSLIHGAGAAHPEQTATDEHFVVVPAKDGHKPIEGFSEQDLRSAYELRHSNQHVEAAKAFARIYERLSHEDKCSEIGESMLDVSFDECKTGAFAMGAISALTACRDGFVSHNLSCHVGEAQEHLPQMTWLDAAMALVDHKSTKSEQDDELPESMRPGAVSKPQLQHDTMLESAERDDRVEGSLPSRVKNDNNIDLRLLKFYGASVGLVVGGGAGFIGGTALISDGVVSLGDPCRLIEGGGRNCSDPLSAADSDYLRRVRRIGIAELTAGGLLAGAGIAVLAVGIARLIHMKRSMSPSGNVVPPGRRWQRSRRRQPIMLSGFQLRISF